MIVHWILRENFLIALLCPKYFVKTFLVFKIEENSFIFWLKATSVDLNLDESHYFKFSIEEIEGKE